MSDITSRKRKSAISRKAHVLANAYEERIKEILAYHAMVERFDDAAIEAWMPTDEQHQQAHPDD